MAESLAQRLASIVPLSREDEKATLAAFSNPAVAEGINATIERGLALGRAEDLTARYRHGDRLVRFAGGVYLLPTVIYCEDAEHPLANQEFLFPFTSVVEVPALALCDSLGPSLVVTALTEDRGIRNDLMDRPDIGRLNLGPIPTTTIQWDQPHEGNLFTHLYHPRAFQQCPLGEAVRKRRQTPCILYEVFTA